MQLKDKQMNNYVSGNARIEKLLFYLVLIFSCLAYIGYYFYAERNGVSLLISYSRSNDRMMKTRDFLTLGFRFGKDVCVSLLLLVEMISMNRTPRAKVFLGMLIAVGYGSVVALGNNMTINTIISGYRMVLYFCALSMFFVSKRQLAFSLKFFLRLITVLLLFNVVIAMQQANNKLGLDISRIGRGSYRFMGVFPAAAAFAYFCLGAALFAFCIEVQTTQYHHNCIFIYLLAFVGCYLSGTRSSLVNIFLVFFIHIIERSDMKKRQKLIVSILLSIPVMVYVVQFSTNVANRGSILLNAIQGGRFSIFQNAILSRPVLSILFGSGIGAGSNTSTEFLKELDESNMLFLDGTFTLIIYQFGVLGMVFLFLLLRYIYVKVREERGVLIALLFLGTIILQCLTTNVLEAFAILVMLFVCFYALTQGGLWFDGISQERGEL